MPVAIRNPDGWHQLIQALISAGANEALDGLPIRLVPRFGEETQHRYRNAAITGAYGTDQSHYIALVGVDDQQGYVCINPKYIVPDIARIKDPERWPKPTAP